MARFEVYNVKFDGVVSKHFYNVWTCCRKALVRVKWTHSNGFQLKSIKFADQTLNTKLSFRFHTIFDACYEI